MKRIPYKLIISIAVIVEVLILLFIEMKVAKYGPIIFWVIAVGLLINVVMIWRKLTESLKTSNPDIYRKHLISFLGVKRIHQLAFLNKEVLNALNEKQRALSEEKNSLLKYFFLCFVLFGVSSLLTVIKTWYKGNKVQVKTKLLLSAVQPDFYVGVANKKRHVLWVIRHWVGETNYKCNELNVEECPCY